MSLLCVSPGDSKAPLEYHQIADFFPLMDEPELKALADDISAHGLRDPIWIDDQDRIVDGRNRYRACRIAGIAPVFRQYKEAEHGPLVPFVVSLNLKRRHLSEAQRAAIAARLAGLAHGSNQHRERSTDRSSSLSDQQAAKLLHVGVASVRRAKRVQREAPEVLDKIQRGDLSLRAAVAQLPSTKRSKTAEKTSPPQPETVARDYEQVAEQVCTLCNRLAEVAELVTPDDLWAEIAIDARFMNNLNRTLDEAAGS